ncbi:MAG TPA: RNA polymerase recycling motor HelD, partial [Bacillales bacterium]|nr:RNA polymerase recycling motor HelD [Bacillales bacterium]
DEPDDRIETEASIRQQAELLSERERSHGIVSEQMKTLKRLEDTPYFGRIDFFEENEKESEPIYIGIASLMDEKEEDFLIYDWRAPVSSMYYDYPPGPAKYDTIDGPVQGEITLKRQFIIKNGVMEGVFDTGLTIGDQLLQKMLGNQSDTNMKSIVSTIQKEQNRIIRDEKHRYLIVQGVAGSGKTSAALQRVAYLLYAHRERLNAENMILFSPNPLFNSYVSTVLPELGENNLIQTTFSEYAEDQLGKEFHVEDPFEQMEWSLNRKDGGKDETRIAAIQYKAGLEFKRMIDDYARQLAESGLIFESILFHDDVLIDANEISEYFYQTDRAMSLPNRLDATMEWLLEKLDRLEETEREKPWVEEEIELLDKEDYLEAHKELQQQQRFTESTFNDFERERELLSRTLVAERFQPIREKIDSLDFVDLKATYAQLFTNGSSFIKETPKSWSEICKFTMAKLADNELPWEDATPYLYFRDLIRGRAGFNWIRHIFIDEAQDYTPFQFEYMKRIFPRCQMTLLGDVNQAIHTHSQSVPSVLSAGTGDPGREERIELMRSYRSTEPIVNFTKQIISGGEAIIPFNREGEKPKVMQVENKEELNRNVLSSIRQLREKGHKTIAVICKTLQESQEVFRHLKTTLDVQILDKETYTFEKGVLVIPAYLAKGIEFDAVILHDASEKVYRRESERNLFYTACTRAMHELYVYS